MHLLLLGLIFSIANVALGSDVLERHQSICDGYDTCRMFLRKMEVPEDSGACTGQLTEKMTCRVSYMIFSGVTVVNLECQEAKAVKVNQELVVESHAYQLAASYTDELDQRRVFVDPRTHLLITNEFVDILVSKTYGEKEYFIKLRLGIQGEFRNLVCESTTSGSVTSSNVQPQIWNQF